MWLLVFSAILFPLIAFLMPKRIPRFELYATSGVAIYVQLLTDVFLHIELNWYGYFDPHPRSEWATLWLVPMYYSINPIFLNFYPYHKNKLKQMVYILGWSAFSVIYEWLFTKTGMFYHNEWRLYHSAITYPVLFTLLRLQLTLVRKIRKRDAKDSFR